MPQVDVDGLTFDVRYGGPEDGEPVLLLHGFPANARSWDQVAGLLAAAGRRAIAVDQRGYSPGARPADPGAYAMEHLVADVTGLLDALGLSTVDLVGHDWGSIVGWYAAAEHPDRFRSWTAVSVPHPAAFRSAIAEDPDQQQRSSYIKLFRRVGRAEEVMLADGARRLRAMLDPLPESTVDEYALPLQLPGALTAALNWYRVALNAAEPGPVGVPTTFLWPNRDLAVGPVAAERCAEHVTGPYRFVELDGITHWAPEQAPGPIAEAVLGPPTG